MSKVYSPKIQQQSDIQQQEEIHKDVPVSSRPRFMNEIMARHRNRRRTEAKRKIKSNKQQEMKIQNILLTQSAQSVLKGHPEMHRSGGNKSKEVLFAQVKEQQQEDHIVQRKITYVHGNKIQGQWKNGTLHGNVVIQYQTGQFFSGKYVNGVRVSGKVVFKDGTQYNGGFLKDIFHGEGTLKDPTGRLITCNWQQGQPSNKAKIQYPSGDIYFGEVLNLKKHGQGHLFFKNGNKYIGKFVNGQITGYGCYYQNEIKIAEGVWQNGVLQIQKNVRQILIESIKNQNKINIQFEDKNNIINTNNNSNNTAPRKCLLKLKI